MFVFDLDNLIFFLDYSWMLRCCLFFFPCLGRSVLVLVLFCLWLSGICLCSLWSDPLSLLCFVFGGQVFTSALGGMDFVLVLSCLGWSGVCPCSVPSWSVRYLSRIVSSSS